MRLFTFCFVYHCGDLLCIGDYLLAILYISWKKKITALKLNYCFYRGRKMKQQSKVILSFSFLIQNDVKVSLQLRFVLIFCSHHKFQWYINVHYRRIEIITITCAFVILLLICHLKYNCFLFDLSQLLGELMWKVLPWMVQKHKTKIVSPSSILGMIVFGQASINQCAEFTDD